MRMVFPNHMTGRFMDELASDMNTLFHSLLGESSAEACGENGCETKSEAKRWARPMDVLESEHSFHIVVDLPGVDAEAIEIDVEDETVSISAERQHGPLPEGETLHRRERRDGRFHRSVTLPKKVDRDAVSAAYVDGVLNLTLPKAVEESTKVRVTVASAKAVETSQADPAE